jgi:hypothetical protein
MHEDSIAREFLCVLRVLCFCAICCVGIEVLRVQPLLGTLSVFFLSFVSCNFDVAMLNDDMPSYDTDKHLIL